MGDVAESDMVTGLFCMYCQWMLKTRDNLSVTSEQRNEIEFGVIVLE